MFLYTIGYGVAFIVYCLMQPIKWICFPFSKLYSYISKERMLKFDPPHRY